MVDCCIVHLGLSRWLIVVLHLGCPSFSCSAFTVRTMRYTSDISVPFTHTGDSTSNLSFQSCISPITRHLMISIQQRIAIVAISCPTHVHCSTQYRLTNLLQYLVYIYPSTSTLSALTVNDHPSPQTPPLLLYVISRRLLCMFMLFVGAHIIRLTQSSSFCKNTFVDWVSIPVVDCCIRTYCTNQWALSIPTGVVLFPSAPS